ncbi:MAG TPA: HAMP domain-containing sensor histidine kinase [Polyangiaceae bacterium]
MSTGRSGKGADLLRLQREANEQLVLAGLRAHEVADDAVAAQRRAEGETGELRVREEELRATAEFRERLIGIIGHDLRSPVSAIVMAGSMLTRDGTLNEGSAQLARRIVSSGDRVLRILSQLVEFTRARLGGGFELKLTPTDLGAVCREIAEELRISTAAEIRETHEGDLRGFWDFDRLTEVISNIAGNAVSHAAPGTPILIHVYDDGDTVGAEITNQGKCIPPDLLPVIFEPFRGSNATERVGHLGLGLYIADQIALSHGGSIAVRSAGGVTTFTLRLPRSARPSPST